MTQFEASEGRTHPWDKEFDRLRAQFPGTTDGVLFCLHKLQQDPSIRLGDFRPEADLHGLKVSGASFHSARVLLGLDKKRERPPSEGDDNGWSKGEARLRREFPDATPGILFCIYKLREDPALTIRDFREEAAEHGIKLGGRALHSARRLLGVQQETNPRIPRGGGPSGSSLGTMLHEALHRMRDEASSEAAHLRNAIRRATQILGEALEEEP